MEKDKIVDNLLNESDGNKEKAKDDVTSFFAEILEKQKQRDSVFEGLSIDERAELVGEYIKKNIGKELFVTDDELFNEAYAWDYAELVDDFLISIPNVDEYIDIEKGDESDLLHFTVSAIPLIIDGEKVLITEVSGQGEEHTFVHTEKNTNLDFVKKYYDFDDFIKGEL